MGMGDADSMNTIKPIAFMCAEIKAYCVISCSYANGYRDEDIYFSYSRDWLGDDVRLVEPTKSLLAVAQGAYYKLKLKIAAEIGLGAVNKLAALVEVPAKQDDWNLLSSLNTADSLQDEQERLREVEIAVEKSRQ